MNLKDKINDDLKEALKAKDKIRLNTVRSIRALILEFEKSGKDKTITKEVEINMLSTAAKKRKEAIEQYEKAGRTDLANNEKIELEIIQSYLPKQLTKEELIKGISDLAGQIGASGKADFAKLMPLAIKTFRGKADGKTIKEVVESILN